MWEKCCEPMVLTSSDDSPASSLSVDLVISILNDWFIDKATIVIGPVTEAISLESRYKSMKEAKEDFNDDENDDDWELVQSPRRRRLLNRQKSWLEQELFIASLKLSSNNGSKRVYQVLYLADGFSDDIRPEFYPDMKAIRYVIEYEVLDESSHQRIIRIGLETCDLKGSLDEKLTVFDTLSGHLLQRLVKWIRNSSKPGGYVKKFSFDQMVPKELFKSVLEPLKGKYRNYWINEWPKYYHTKGAAEAGKKSNNHSLSPCKMVSEEISISAFLISLWSKLGHAKSDLYFVDLGCGNGFLSYLLHNEGYSGHGIDVWARPIWSALNTSKDSLDGNDLELLRQETIENPNTYHNKLMVHARSNSNLWLIGNHADELVCWLPILAHRLKCNFMVLPCCFYGLNGSKMTRKHSSTLTQYQEYLASVEKVILDCGFRLNREVLRIPSTKNIAFVGIFGEDGDAKQSNLWHETEMKLAEIIDRAGVFKARLSDREKTFQRLDKLKARGLLPGNAK